MQNQTTPNLVTFDVRAIPCRVKHGQIFQRWADLRVGEHFVLINDHDPVPLYYQFAAQFPDAFRWEYVVAGPDEFQVRITRLAETPVVGIAPPPRPPAVIAAAAAAGAVEVDARGLEPPEPMMRILEALGQLGTADSLRARTDRRPVHLLPELEQRGLRYVSEQQPDGSWCTLISGRRA